VNDSAAAVSHPSGQTGEKMVDNMQALQNGFKLARASQLTMLRLQLALHASNPDTAMEALDILLDIDAEMESIEATLIENVGHLANDAALSGFIRFQKTAIASEKHALTGGDRRSLARSNAIPAACDLAEAIDLSARPLFSGDEVESDQQGKGRRWMLALTVAAVVAFIGCGLAIYWY
jgi:hypothetical protein